MDHGTVMARVHVEFGQVREPHQPEEGVIFELCASPTLLLVAHLSQMIKMYIKTPHHDAHTLTFTQDGITPRRLQ